MISKPVKISVEATLGKSVKNFHSVSGGSINQATKITDEDETSFFLKWNSSAAADMFAKEQLGLNLLRSAGSGLRIPEVIATGATNDGTGFIILEFIQEGSPGTHAAADFGERLAALHQTTVGAYGLAHDNYIGRLPQSNKKHENWIDFFVEERLQPQVKMVIDEGKLSAGIANYFQRLYKTLPDILVDEPASMLHGDLWSGNFMYDGGGNPSIYDPAVYYGNREIEMAFTHLFGGFSTKFYQAYQKTFPLQPHFKERKDIYNLYPLLVHTNMFGGRYGQQVKSIIKQF